MNIHMSTRTINVSGVAIALAFALGFTGLLTLMVMSLYATGAEGLHTRLFGPAPTLSPVLWWAVMVQAALCMTFGMLASERIETQVMLGQPLTVKVTLPTRTHEPRPDPDLDAVVFTDTGDEALTFGTLTDALTYLREVYQRKVLSERALNAMSDTTALMERLVATAEDIEWYVLPRVLYGVALCDLVEKTALIALNGEGDLPYTFRDGLNAIYHDGAFSQSVRVSELDVAVKLLNSTVTDRIDPVLADLLLREARDLLGSTRETHPEE